MSQLYQCDQARELSTNSYVCGHCVLITGGKHKPLCTLAEYLGVGPVLEASTVWTGDQQRILRWRATEEITAESDDEEWEETADESRGLVWRKKEGKKE